MKKNIISVVAVMVLSMAAKVFFGIPLTVSLTVLAVLAAIRYLPNIIGKTWASVVVTVAVLFLMYSAAAWVTEKSLPFATKMKPFGILSIDNTIASMINRPGTKGEQKLLDLTFSKEDQTDPAKIKEAFGDDPLEAARLLGQQQADGQVIRDMANPLKKPVDIAQYRLERANKDLRDSSLILQAMAKEAKAKGVRGTIAKNLVSNDKKGNVVTVFKAGDRVALASTKTYTKGAELLVLVYRGENEVFIGYGQPWCIPFSCVKWDVEAKSAPAPQQTTAAPAKFAIEYNLRAKEVDGIASFPKDAILRISVEGNTEQPVYLVPGMHLENGSRPYQIKKGEPLIFTAISNCKVKISEL